MALTIEDLKPKSFKVKIRGVEVDCNPPRLSHTLLIAKIGNVFTDVNQSTSEQIRQAETDMDSIVAELLPELKGIQLDMSSCIELIGQIMESVQPSDNKYLDDKGVKIDVDPKAEKIG